MPRPRYSANKRAREISKRQERARKLARKHNRTAQRAASEAAEMSMAPDTQDHALEDQSPEESGTGSPTSPGDPDGESDPGRR